MNNPKTRTSIEIFFVAIIVFFFYELSVGVFTEENLYGFILISLLLILILRLQTSLKTMFSNEVKNLYKNLIIQKIIKLNLLLLCLKKQFHLYKFFNNLFVANKTNLGICIKIINTLIILVKKKKYFLYLRIFFFDVLKLYANFQLDKNLLINLNFINLKITNLNKPRDFLGYLIYKQKIYKH